MKTAVIVNPRSGSGKTAKLWPPMADLLKRRIGAFTVRATESAGHATALARELLGEGFDRIIAAGGDGTVNEVANGFLRDDEPLRPDACLATLPFGTGGDLGRTLGIRNIEQALETLATGVPREVDMGKVSYRAYDGSSHTRYFCNLVSFGMGGEVARRSKNFLHALGGKAAFLYATIQVFFLYKPKTVRLLLDDRGSPQPFTVTNVAIGNGRYHGGGMHVCPRARMNDGLLDVTVIDAIGMVELARDLPLLYSDDVYRHPKTHHFRAAHILADSSEIVEIEIDGEALGTLPLELRILPKRLRILSPQV